MDKDGWVKAGEVDSQKHKFCRSQNIGFSNKTTFKNQILTGKNRRGELSLQPEHSTSVFVFKAEVMKAVNDVPDLQNVVESHDPFSEKHRLLSTDCSQTGSGGFQSLNQTSYWKSCVTRLPPTPPPFLLLFLPIIHSFGLLLPSRVL